MLARMLTLAVVPLALALPASASASTCSAPYDLGRYRVTHLVEFNMTCHEATAGVAHYLRNGTPPAGFQCTKHESPHTTSAVVECSSGNKFFQAHYERAPTHGPTE
jgi:hypothetical protein